MASIVPIRDAPLPHPRQLAGPQQFSRDRAKLIRYYRLAGFTPVIGGGLMVSSLPLNTTNKAHHEEG